MHKIDHLNIDGHLLLTLVTIYEEGSVTKAAARLNINQSTMSHRLERLRSAFGRRIFVRAGRGIVPTSHTAEVVKLANEALESMRLMLEPERIDPSKIDDRFVIGASDYERAVFLLDAYREIRQRAPGIQIQFVWEKYDVYDELRKGAFDMSISPLQMSKENDIRRQPLFEDRVVCFYDPACTRAPSTMKRYTEARHVRVLFSDRDFSFVDRALVPLGVKRNMAITMPSISELPYIMKGTDLIATVPSRLKQSIMADFALCPLPFRFEPLTYGLFWHDRTQTSKKHAWVRQQFFDAAAKLTSGTGPG